MIKVAELKGFKALRAFNAYNTLLLGLKMLPEYGKMGYEEFFSKMDLLPPEDQRKLIVEATLFVKLEDEEIEAMISFCSDSNGVKYSKENMKNLGPGEQIELIVAVCLEMAKIKIDFVSDAEKKK